MRWRRFRTWAKWTCTGAAILLGIVWLASPWLHVGWARRDWTADIGAGTLDLCSCRTPVPAGFQGLWFLRQEPTAMRWKYESFDFGNAAQGILGHCYAIPLWPPLLFAIIATTVLWWPVLRGWRRERAGCCARCGYERRGLAPDAKCPECGANPVGG